MSKALRWRRKTDAELRLETEKLAADLGETPEFVVKHRLLPMQPHARATVMSRLKSEANKGMMTRRVHAESN